MLFKGRESYIINVHDKKNNECKSMPCVAFWTTARGIQVQVTVQEVTVLVLWRCSGAPNRLMVMVVWSTDNPVNELTTIRSQA